MGVGQSPPAGLDRPQWRRRARCEVRDHAEPGRGRHGQHRLRPGRDQRAASQPDQVQLVFPREARVLPREPGPVCLRWCRGRTVWWWRRYLRHVLQPPDRVEQGREIPLDVGGRFTGRVGAFSIGALNIHTGDEPISGARPTNFSAVRVKRDLFRRSSLGAIFTRRSLSTRSPGSNETYGLDETFAFYDNISFSTYWAKTRTQGFEKDVSYRANFDCEGDRYGVEVERLVVGTGFNPEIGFLRRDDLERSFGSFWFSPRHGRSPRSASCHGAPGSTTSRTGRGCLRHARVVLQLWPAAAGSLKRW